LFGDSYAEGFSVPDGYTIADVIRRDTSFSVYNAGKGGVGLVHKLAIFIEYGLGKSPEYAVLVMPEGASLNRATQELEVEQLRRYYEEHTSVRLLDKNPL